MNIEAYAHPETIPSGEPSRIGRLLGLEDADALDEVGLARRVAAGLPPETASALDRRLGGRHAATPLVPEATLRRVRQACGRLSREHSERLYELGRVLDAVGRIYRGDADRAGAFLDRPHPLLGGDTPLQMARSSSAGTTAVLTLLGRIEAGVAL